MNDQTEELNKLMEEWASAELRGDTTFLKSFLADNFVGIGPRGFTLTKDQWLARYESGDLKYESFGLDEVRVRLYGGAAVTTCPQSQAREYQGHDVRGEFRATLVFVEQQGRWLLASVHLSPIAEGS